MGDRRLNIKRWQNKNKIKFLDTARGNEKSLFSLIMPYLDPIPRVITSLNNEYKKALVIEDRVHRSCYFRAIDSAKQRLKKIKRVRFDGLALYTGTIINEDGKEEKFTTDFVPFEPIKASVYRFDSVFHTEALHELLDSGLKFGIVLMDNRGVSFGTLRHTTYEILHDYIFPDHLPFTRRFREDLTSAYIRMESTYRSYYMQSAGFARHCYLDPETLEPKVFGLILAGNGHFMDALSQELHPTLHQMIRNVVDVQYRGRVGLDHVVEMSEDVLARVRFRHEKRLLSNFFGEVASEKGMAFYGLAQTFELIFKLGAIKVLFVWEDLDVMICVMKSSSSGRREIKHLKSEEEGNPENDEWVVVQEKISLLEWLANEYTRFGFDLDIVSNHTHEGLQFHRGFGGIGGIRLHKEPGDDSKDGETDPDDGDDSKDGETDPDDALSNFWDDL